MDITSADLHIHTNLSLCAVESARAGAYIDAAARGNIKTVGFSNHYWDEDVPGASDWYKVQNTQHVMQLKEELGDVSQYPVRVLFGCECEFAHGDTLSISEKKAQLFDYVLVPHSHTHMLGFVLPVDCQSPEKHADFLVKSFFGVVTHPLAKQYITGIVHPFDPCGKTSEQAKEILSGISDSVFYECACAAKENNVAVELNSSSFTNLAGAAMPEYLRFYHACKKAGCVFFSGSDRHKVREYDSADPFMKLKGIADGLEITDLLTL
ncbi:MAG TPA: hypothetical protein PLT66_00200 [Bacillota bacterium]|nr:hypothetical protein [Bacillota bacterium]